MRHVMDDAHEEATMKVLAILRPAAVSDVRGVIAGHARDELHALWRLYRENAVREMYAPGCPGAVLILEATSAEEAARQLQELPLLTSRTMTLETIELHPFQALEMLFHEPRPWGSAGKDATREGS